jgi:hypothetical protein
MAPQACSCKTHAQAVRPTGKAGDQALRRSAFQEAISHLGKAIAMADKASGRVLARRDRGAPAASEQNLTLRTNFARAVMMTKGLWCK